MVRGVRAPQPWQPLPRPRLWLWLPPWPFPRPGAHQLLKPRWDESSDNTRSIWPAACDREQPAKAIVGGQLELGVHLDGLERTNFNANLAAHANRDIDVEARRIKLLFAHIIRLLVLAFVDVNALGWALLLADLAGHAAQSCFPVRCRRTPERETRAQLRPWESAPPDTPPWSAVLWRRSSGRNSSPSPPFPSGCLHQAEDTLHVPLNRKLLAAYLSTSPSTISTLPKISTTSATLCPRHMSSRTVRLIRLGGRTR